MESKKCDQCWGELKEAYQYQIGNFMVCPRCSPQLKQFIIKK